MLVRVDLDENMIPKVISTCVGFLEKKGLYATLKVSEPDQYSLICMHMCKKGVLFTRLVHFYRTRTTKLLVHEHLDVCITPTTITAGS